MGAGATRSTGGSDIGQFPPGSCLAENCRSCTGFLELLPDRRPSVSLPPPPTHTSILILMVFLWLGMEVGKLVFTKTFGSVEICAEVER